MALRVPWLPFEIGYSFAPRCLHCQEGLPWGFDLFALVNKNWTQMDVEFGHDRKFPLPTPSLTEP